jgi:hypothetical protein
VVAVFKHQVCFPRRLDLGFAAMLADQQIGGAPDVQIGDTRHRIDLSLLFDLCQVVEDNFRRAVVQLDCAADADALTLRPLWLSKLCPVVAENDRREDCVRIGLAEIQEGRLRS